MASKSERSTHAQIIADRFHYTNRVFRSCRARSEALRALSTTLATSRTLMAEIDVLLAKGNRTLIEEYGPKKKEVP